MQLAKQQEQIRRELMEIRNDISDKRKINKIIKEMEENERDIINNNITQETITRQEEILTRLLDTEKSERERQKENKRTATEWKFKNENYNKQILEYQKKKKNEEELLRTSPIQLNPFYKKKVTNYFKNLINSNK